MQEDINTIHSVRKYIIFGIVAVVLVSVVLGGIVLFTSDSGDSLIDINVTRQDNTRDDDRVDAPDPMPDDFDRDGILDAKETELGLSIVNPDTDADGLFDNDEITVFKSDPLKFDTDGDGFGDGWEVLKGYNPAGPGVLPTEIN